MWTVSLESGVAQKKAKMFKKTNTKTKIYNELLGYLEICALYKDAVKLNARHTSCRNT